jgi:thiol-disulfide isomerase/thioredoxin
MKKLLLTILILTGWIFLTAQPRWLTDLDVAKKMSLATGKLLVIDFWASWCGPCQKMENELWNSKEISNISDNFIGVKINVDFDRSAAMEYSAQAIPKLVVAMFNGEVLWETVGYSSPSPFIELLVALPKNSSALYKVLNNLKQDEKNPELQLLTGIEFQKRGKDIPNSTLREVFFSQALFKFRRAGKLSGDPLMKQRAELYDVLFDVYRGKPQKALKSMGKMEVSKDNAEISELSHFVLALCHKALNDDQAFLKEKEFISNEKFLAELVSQGPE